MNEDSTGALDGSGGDAVALPLLGKQGHRDNGGDEKILVTAYALNDYAGFREGFGTLRNNGGDNGGGSESLVAFTMEQEPKWGDVAGTLGTYNGRRAGVASASVWHENKGGSFTEAETARALRSGASRSYQGVGVRRLTPLECERLQGFPDGWTEGFADSVRYRMLGNAVAVPVVEWLANRIAVMPL